MIKSMTAFARKQAQGEWGSASVEIKTVNHRYFDVNLRLPEMLREMEMPLRDVMRKQVQRGKLDCTIRYTLGSAIDTKMQINETLLTQLIDVAKQVDSKLASSAPLNLFELLRWPGVIQIAEQDTQTAQQAILALASEALAELNSVREREGAALAECVITRINGIESQIELIIPRTKEIVAEQRQRLQNKITELDVKFDEERLEQEILLMAQRIDIAEELDRLATHIKEVKRVVKQNGAIGRRLDFLMQELNREANTIASKSIDVSMTQAVVEIKVLIEQMREQIQNIE